MTTRIVSELATPAEAAAELRCSVHTVKRWAREGQIAAVKTPGGHWRIPLSELRVLRTHREYAERPADLRGAL
jgi:excisionase family DNA binding protein